MADQKTPWLFLEPDCCPLRAGWLDAIAAEYKAAGKPFTGARVEVADVPLHMSGNAVYPVDMFAHAGLALIANDIAWDVAAASQIVPQAHFTKLIEHAWKHPTFESWEQVEREVSKEAVVYHASKDGSLIRLLRERTNLAASKMDPVTPSLGSTGDKERVALSRDPLNDPENPRYGSASETRVVPERRGSSGGAEMVRPIIFEFRDGRLVCLN